MSVTKRILKNREEWLENRMKGIGGSEISAVVGCNPYLDNVTLFERKTGRIIAEDISEKPYVKYGTLAEKPLRELFCLDFPEYEMEYEENNSYSNSKYPWALASVDGLLHDKQGRLGIWECKTTNILRSMQNEHWRDEKIPQNYYCQCLFYMAVLEADFCILKAQLKSILKNGEQLIRTKHYHFEREEVQDDIDYLMREGEKFWEYVKNDKYPPLTLPNI